MNDREFKDALRGRSGCDSVEKIISTGEIEWKGTSTPFRVVFTGVEKYQLELKLPGCDKFRIAGWGHKIEDLQVEDVQNLEARLARERAWDEEKRQKELEYFTEKYKAKLETALYLDDAVTVPGTDKIFFVTDWYGDKEELAEFCATNNVNDLTKERMLLSDNRIPLEIGASYGTKGVELHHYVLEGRGLDLKKMRLDYEVHHLDNCRVIIITEEDALRMQLFAGENPEYAYPVFDK